MTSEKPTQFPELNELLRGWVEAASRILEDNFVGAYLVGSFALGDADIHSDCDFLVVVRNSLIPTQEAGLRALHRQIFRRSGHWTQHLEGSYAPENELRSLGGRNRWLFLDNAHDEMEWSTHCNSLEHRWTLRERGIILAGRDPKELVDKVDPEALRGKMRQLVQTFLLDLATWIRLDSVAWAQRYAVATICRILYSIETAEIASKRASLVWAKEHLDSAWCDLIQHALEGRHLGWNPNDLPSKERAQQTVAFAEYAKAWAAGSERSEDASTALETGAAGGTP
jgi:Domain of unknown function (DUF4111)/Nucleotidyltransferase domain